MGVARSFFDVHSPSEPISQGYDSSKRLLSTHTKMTAGSSELTLVEGSSISGTAVAIQAGNDVTIQASDVMPSRPC